MMNRNGDWMQTFTGRQFWPLDPRAEEVCIEDIAHALSNQCRYAGHCNEFYSVAQHSVLVSEVCCAEDALWGLLHDAAEAYLVDLPRPIKRFSEIGTHYKKAENALIAVVCERFGLPLAEPASVKTADNIMLITEKRDLMSKSPEEWIEERTSKPLPGVITPWSPSMAKAEFLRRFEELTK
jgi:5'-nucleotidase